jgi:arylsulfatase A-like enzyme
LRSQWFFTRREGGLRYGGKTIEAVREGPWKLLQNSPFAPLELYHLQQDPLESQNLVEKHPAIVNRLNAALRRHLQRGGAIPWQPPMPADSQ